MALVLDASVLAEFLVGSRVGVVAAEHMAEHSSDLHVPHLAVIETASVLRSWTQRNEVTVERATAAVTDLTDLPAQRWPGEPLLPRMWDLRDNVTAYDALRRIVRAAGRGARDRRPTLGPRPRGFDDLPHRHACGTVIWSPAMPISGRRIRPRKVIRATADSS